MRDEQLVEILVVFEIEADEGVDLAHVRSRRAKASSN